MLGLGLKVPSQSSGEENSNALTPDVQGGIEIAVQQWTGFAHSTSRTP
jgi:hypothetical protein